jgi:imidazolonepropionase-like amidohydrolase
MDAERLLEDQTVIIRGDRIAGLGPANQMSIPSDAQIVEGRGAFLMPGLADMHYHVDRDPVSLALAVANGVTTVQNLNAWPEELTLAVQTEAGKLFGPRIINGPHATGLPPHIGFAFHRVNEAVAPFFSLKAYVDAANEPYGFQVDAESGRDFVLHAKEIGGDFIKTNLFVGREAFDAMVEAANDLGMKVQGHVWGEIGLEHYIESGGQVHHVTEIMPYLSESNPQGIPLQRYDLLHVDDRLPRLIALMKENEMAFTPTVNLFWYLDQHYRDFEGLMAEPQLRYMPPDKVRQWQDRETNFVFRFFAAEEFEETRRYAENMTGFQARLIRDLREAGVTILAGTDATAAPGSVWGLTLHKELQLLHECGLTTYESLETATRLPAEFYDQADEWGTVDAGKRANLLLLGANPLEDITHTRAILGVVLRGEWFAQEALQAKLDEILIGYEAMDKGGNTNGTPADRASDSAGPRVDASDTAGRQPLDSRWN